MKNTAFLLLTFFTSITLFGQDIVGKWDGTINAQGVQIKLVFNISKTDDIYTTTMDSPSQGAFGIPLDITTFSNAVIKVTIAAAQIEYEGTLNNTEIIGFWKQAGQSFPLNLSKSKEEIETITLEANTNYTENPIVLETPTGKIYGTLTTPKEFKNIPVALIIAGSGPTDRNCNNQSMRCDAFKILAHQLADKNIASVRYDKRGIAQSSAAGKKESELRFEDLIDDAKEWVNLIKQDKRFSKITVIGHSEGSLIGMKAAVNADKYISISGPGKPAADILKEQLSNQSQEYKDVAYPILDEMVKGNVVNNVNPDYNDLFRPSVQPYLISWFKYNPQTEIQKLKIPTLIIQGSNDIQVAVADAELLAKSNKKATLKIFENMNHVFRTVVGNRNENVATYNNPKLPLAEGFVDAITAFILK